MAVGENIFTPNNKITNVAKVTRAAIKINGKPIGFSSLILRQSINWHHYFEVRTSIERPEPNLLSKAAEDYIGKTINIGFKVVPDLEFALDPNVVEPCFEGIITEVDIARSLTVNYELVIRGYSPTIYLDDGPHTCSFTAQTLKQTIDKVLKESKSKLSDGEKTSPKVEPNQNPKIPYFVQYKESHFEFLYRIAARYGEWFYYNGLQLMFAPPENEGPIKLYYGEDLVTFDLSVKTLPIQFSLKGYDYKKHDFPEDTPKLEDLSGLAGIALKKSTGEVYKGKPMSPVIRQMEEKELKDLSKTRQRLQASGMVLLKGRSTNTTLRVGDEITIVDRNFRGDTEEYGSYIIIEVTHDIANDGAYLNQFKAMPVETAFLPLSQHIHPPFCETQVAEVTDINDEDRLGRVKVQFIWQKDTDEKSPWLRIASPYTGGDKGFYIVPEIGDQVLVDFEHHNPDKPYVLSGFYHGKAKPENFDKENNTKVFKTRSGNQIFFSDKAGEETIKINTPDAKNEITLAMGSKPSISIKSEGGSLSLSADSISLTAKEITINGSKSIGLSSEEITSNAQKEFKVDGMDIKLSAKKNTEIEAKGQVGITSTADTSITAMTIKLNC